MSQSISSDKINPTRVKTVLDDILLLAREQNASDVHIAAGNAVMFRRFGEFKPVNAEILTADKVHAILTEGLPERVFKLFEATGDGEYVHTIPGHGRFRMTLMKQRNGFDLTARLIPAEIPTFESTGMPDSCASLTKWAQGLVLITGPAGCGKTTSLAVLVEMINQNRSDHIITIEQPIEIVYKPSKCQITQREVNIHTMSQSNALRAALREDPDILVVSELRDLPTIQLAVTAAETGHLVFGTMNTVNAAQTISRLIDSFPAEEQGIMRSMISESLRGVICQQLIPKKDGTGVVPAYEVLIVNTSIAALIREGKYSLMANSMMTGKAAGMILLDTSLQNLANKGVISNQEAKERATNPATLLLAGN
jgi:twitching motility protein PilT